MPPFLSRPALRRVVESLLRTELTAMNGKRGDPRATAGMPEVWPESLDFYSSTQTGCDSLDLLQLSAAVNEMFHLYDAGLESELLVLPVFGNWLRVIESAWQRGVNRVTFTTSGSTGVPKRCTHTFEHLGREVNYLQSLFSRRKRIVAGTPARHVYGFLFTALLADRLGLPVVELGRRFDLPDESTAGSFQTGDLIVSVPEMWAWLDRSVAHWGADIEGVISTGPCPRETIESLIDRGLAGVTEVYGSTETAGIGARVWPEPVYALMPHWTYKGAPSVPGKTCLQSVDMEVTAMDVLEFRDDRHFVLGGRCDGAVQVGGTNIFLHDVEKALTAHGGVRFAAVRLMRPEEGNRLKCFIVPVEETDTAILRQSLEAHVLISLKTAERPKLYTFGADLPRNASGKLCDW